MQASARPFPLTGGDNGPGDATPVVQCRAPVSGVDQLQCYCTTALCGAGMLDAGAAVAAVSGPLARVEVRTALPTAGQSVTLVGSGSLGNAGSAVTRYEWSLVTGSGIVSGFDSATNAATATLTPSAAGSFTVRLTVADATGATDTASALVTVVAVPAPPVATPPPSGGGGGGATSLLWVLGVLLAVALLHICQLLQARARRAPPR